MKNYDPNITNGIHTVKITLQQWEYVGHIFKKIGGNCKGRNILDFDFECEEGELESDCELLCGADYEFYRAFLKNESGDTLEVNGEPEEFNNMIVAIEILDFERRGARE